jgi:hypothetical protein
VSTTAIAGLASSWVLVSGGLWSLADKAEKVGSTAAKDHLREWLKSVDGSRPFNSLALTFGAAFDSVFGPRLLSIRGFARSCVASVAAIAVVMCVWAIVRPVRFFEFTHNLNQPVYLVPLIMANLLPDYLSLIESRWIITVMSRRPGLLRTIGLLVVNFLLTLGIALVSLYVLVSIIELRTAPIRDYWGLVVSTGFTLNPPDPGEGKPSVGLWIYSTFFTAAWVWLYAASSIFIKLQRRAVTIIERIRWLLDLEKPFLAVAFAGICLVTIGHLLALLIIVL